VPTELDQLEKYAPVTKLSRSCNSQSAARESVHARAAMFLRGGDDAEAHHFGTDLTSLSASLWSGWCFC
jgi:hypothetical protein